MADLAKLGLQIDSSGYVEATQRGNAFAQSAANAERGATKLGSSTKTVSASVFDMATKIRVATVGIVAFVASEALMVQRAMDAAGVLADLADQTQQTTTTIQNLSYEGQQYGISQEKMTTGLLYFNKAFSDFVDTGAGPAKDVFKRLGIDAAISSGQIRDPADALELIQQKFGKVYTSATGAQAAAELFGRGVGTRMTPILLMSAQALEKEAKAAKDSGYTLDENFIKAADRAADQVSVLATAIGNNLIKGALEPLIPKIESLSKLAADPSFINMTKGIGEGAGSSIKYAIDNFDELLRVVEVVGVAYVGTMVGPAIAATKAWTVTVAEHVSGEGRALAMNAELAAETAALAAEELAAARAKEANITAVVAEIRANTLLIASERDLAVSALNRTLNNRQKIVQNQRVIDLTLDETAATQRLAAAEAELAAAQKATAAAAGIAATATTAEAVAMGEAGLMARSLEVGAIGVNRALSFFGGPIGLAIAGIAAALLLLKTNTERVEEALNKSKVAGDTFRDMIDGTTLKIKEQNTALVENERLLINKAIHEAGGTLSNATANIAQPSIRDLPGGGWGASPAQYKAVGDMSALLASFSKAGDTSYDAFLRLDNALLGMQKRFPGLGDATIAEVEKLKELAKQSELSAAQLAALNGKASEAQVKMLREAGLLGAPVTAEPEKAKLTIHKPEKGLSVSNLVDKEISDLKREGDAYAEIGDNRLVLQKQNEIEKAAVDKLIQGNTNLTEAQKKRIIETTHLTQTQKDEIAATVLANEQTKRASAVIEDTTNPAREYAQAITAIQDALKRGLSQDHAEVLYAKASEAAIGYSQALSEAMGPITHYKTAVADLNEQLHLGTISQEQFTDQLAKQQIALLQNSPSFSFADNFVKQLQIMKLESRNAFTELGGQAGKIFGPGGTLVQGIGDATARSIVFGDSFSGAMRDVAATITSQLITAIVQIGLNMLLNEVIGETVAATSMGTTAAMGAASAAAWAPAAALASLATLGTNSAPAMAGIAGTMAMTQALALTSAAIPGFADGVTDIKGAGTGTSDSILAWLSNGESVVNERATRGNKTTIAAMNAGASIDAVMARQASAPANSNDPTSSRTGGNGNSSSIVRAIGKMKNGPTEMGSQSVRAIRSALRDAVKESTGHVLARSALAPR